MPRGGRRTGTPGAQYANRSDLQQGARPLPISNVRGQQYGQASAQQAAQRALPMAPTPLPPAPSPELAGQQNVSPAAPPLTPQDVPNLADPTARPDEHVMSGAPTGPGAMPPPPLPAQYTSAKDFLAGALSMGPAAGNSEVQFLLQQLQARGM